MIKKATQKDIPTLQKLFIETVLEVNRKDYSEEQVKDWASCGTDLTKWEKRLMEYDHYVCIKNHEIAGFTAFNTNGFINSMFVSKNFQRCGVAQQLMDLILEESKRNNVGQLTSEVSITAKPFFEKNGFVVVRQQDAIANRLTLINYVMELKL